MNDKIKISNQAFFLLMEIKKTMNADSKEEASRMGLRNYHFLLEIQDLLLGYDMTYDELHNALEEIKAKNIIKEYKFDRPSFKTSSFFSVLYNEDYFDFGEQAIKNVMMDDKERFLLFQEGLQFSIRNYNILDDDYYVGERDYFVKKYFDFVPEFLKNRRSKEDFISYLAEIASGDGSYSKRRKSIFDECRPFLDFLEFGIQGDSQGSNIIFSNVLILKVPNDIKILCEEFNFNYSNSKWNAAMLLLRRILPLSIVRKFQQLDEEGKIRDKISNDFLETKELLNKVEGKLRNKRVFNDLSVQKQIIDASQHSYTFKISELDVKNSANSVRILLDDMFDITEKN